MPKIAANEIERTLLLADAEAVTVSANREEIGRRREELMEAFKNASRLRNINYHVVLLRGRKRHAVQPVVRTTIKRTGEKGGTYVLCLFPNPGARKPFRFQTEIWGEGDVHTRKLIGMKDHYLGMPAGLRSQWVSEERLREAA
jgi:hypothetical protein